MSKKLIAGAGVVASFAIALAPLATFATDGVVSDQHTDKLVLTVLPSCTFGSVSKSASGIAHDDSTDNYGADGSSTTQSTITATAWNTDSTTDEVDSVSAHTSDVTDSTGYGILDNEGGLTTTNHEELANHSKHTVHRSMLAGTTTATFAQTAMTVYCNNGGGYSITGQATALAGTSTNIPVNNTYSASVSGYNLATLAVSGGSLALEQVSSANVTHAEPTSETVLAHSSTVTAETGDTLTVTYGMGVSSNQQADTYVGTVTYKLYKGVNGVNSMVIPPAGN